MCWNGFRGCGGESSVKREDFLFGKIALWMGFKSGTLVLLGDESVTQGNKLCWSKIVFDETRIAPSTFL